jgi:hypothetical protein
MSTHVLLVDLVGLILAAAGFHLAFRQRLVRHWLDAYRARQGRLPLRRAAGDAEDPVHYAMIIFGTMLMAFGLIIIAFTTVFALAS